VEDVKAEQKDALEGLANSLNPENPSQNDRKTLDQGKSSKSQLLKKDERETR